MAEADNPAISILIPAFNEERLIEGVIDSVRKSFAAIGFDRFEIVVCDNNSTDQTAAIATARGAKIVFEPHNQIARARNTAAAQARGNWFIFLDGDTYLNPGLLKATIEAFASGKVCGGGSTVSFDRTDLGFLNRAARALLEPHLGHVPAGRGLVPLLLKNRPGRRRAGSMNRSMRGRSSFFRGNSSVGEGSVAFAFAFSPEARL